MAKKKYYAVQKGRIPGVYLTWEECRKQVDGFSAAVYKSFPTREEAVRFAGTEKQKKDSSDTVSEKEPEENTGQQETACAVAYVDGSYHHETRRFSCGVVLFWEGKEYHFSEAFEDPELASMRNVAGEIKGAQRAMEYCMEHGISALCIYHDYEGISKWCEGQWEAKKEGTKAYREFYRSASEKVRISFRKVKGHSGDTYNDLADHLAKEALGLV